MKKQICWNSIASVSRAAALFTFLIMIWASSLSADTAVPSSIAQDKSTWEVIREKTRVRTFTEFMAPALSDNPKSVPEPDGAIAAASNIFNIAWMDYEIAPNYKLLYWQRFTVNLASSGSNMGVHTVARNPRFALRRVNLFSNPNISSTYDLYIQPGLAPEAASNAAGRTFEAGFRTNTSYAFSGTRWNIGAITEFTVSLSKYDSKRADVYGWVMPWVSYDLSKVFSTQHYVTLNFKHDQGTTWHDFQLDTYMPYIQNGIGINVTDKIWAAAFINNYLIAAPSLKNTWASVWLSMNVM